MDMFKRVLALLLVLQLLGLAQSIQEKAVSIPIGSVVEAKLTDKTKVRGQLISVSAQGVSIRTTVSGTVQEKPIAFDQIRTLQEKKQSRTGLKILAGVGIALGTLMIIGLIIVSTAD